MKCIFKSGFFLGLAFCLWPARFVWAQSLPALPPGVEFAELTATPVGVEAHGFSVDWTDPLLQVRVVDGWERPGGLPMPWRRLSADHPDGLIIQLSEPMRTDETWTHGLEAEIPDRREAARVEGPIVVDPPEPTTASPGGTDHVYVGGIAPWFYGGPTVKRDPDPVSPLGEGGARVNVRWLGRIGDWSSRPPAFELKDRAILSVFRPASGKGTFLLLLNRSGGRVPLHELSRWMEENFPLDAWSALHAMGPQATIGIGDWRPGKIPGEAAVERIGAALVLGEVKAGDPIDWARLGKPRLTASSYEGGHPAEAATNGRIWPVPLAPNGWMSRPPDDSRSEAWIEFDLPRAREIREIRLVYAEAAGWSAHFNPAKVRVLHRRGGQGRFEPSIEILEPDRTWTTVRFEPMRILDRVRIEIPEPTRFSLPQSARLTAVQLIGPLPATKEEFP